MARLACETCAVRSKAICSELTRDELTKINAIAHFRAVPAGEVLFADDEPPPYFASILSGVVKLTKSLPDGRQQIVGLLFPSQFLGKTITGRASYSAEAATNARLCTFNRDQFNGILRAHPSLEKRMFEHTLDELDSAREWMLLLGRKTAAEKVASLLVLIARHSRQLGCGDPEHPDRVRFELPLSRSEIADYLGLTIETVSRQLSRFKAKNLISLEGPRVVVVPSLERLAGEAETDEACV
ncbi:MAG: Crp/Fnr family transcriptional regulator [Hyphomicrobium sp.]|nr:Crp/Fnr family transcriptional regulator [Hyphomicrobium sp.]